MSKELPSYHAIIQFNGYIFEELSFLYRGYDEDKEDAPLGAVPTIFQINIGFDKDASSVARGYIRLSCYINKEHSDQFPFSVSSVMRGAFTLAPDIPEGEIRKLLEVNGVAVMFPFLRAAIANLTVAAGVEAVVMPLVDISKLVKDKDAIPS